MKKIEKGFAPSEIAEILGVDYSTLWNWRQKKIGPPHRRIGGRIYYDQKGFYDWWEKKQKEGEI